MEANNSIKKSNLFKRLFTSGYILPALLIAVLGFTFVVADREYILLDRLADIYNNIEFFVYFLFAGAAFLILLYFISEIRSSKVRLADSLAVGLILFGTAFVSYYLITGDVFTTRKLVVAIGSLVLGFGYFFFRLYFYKVATDCDCPRKIAAPKTYLGSVIRKYTLLTMFFTVVTLICIASLGLDMEMKRLATETLATLPSIKYFFYVTALLGLIYAYTSMSKKTINFIDVILLSSLAVYPVMLVCIAILQDRGTLSVTLILIAFAVNILALMIRLVILNVRKKQVDKPEKKGYLKNFFAKYNVFQLLFFASLIVTFLAFILYTDITSFMVRVTHYDTPQGAGFVLWLKRCIIPMFLLELIGATTVVACLITSILNLFNRKISASDGAFWLFLFTTILATLINLIFNSLIYLIVSCTLAALSISLLIAKLIKAKGKF